jgi:hypothetical protein
MIELARQSDAKLEKALARQMETMLHRQAEQMDGLLVAVYEQQGRSMLPLFHQPPSHRQLELNQEHRHRPQMTI